MKYLVGLPGIGYDWIDCHHQTALGAAVKAGSDEAAEVILANTNADITGNVCTLI